jgi:ankyrin repeat protein
MSSAVPSPSPLDEANLERWKSSSAPAAWVFKHGAGWNNYDWTALLSELRETHYWPMNEAAIGQHLEELRDRLPPCYASAEGLPEVVKALLAIGADVNKRDKWGMTALQYAANRGRSAVAELLLAASADANARDGDGKTALYMAAEMDHKGVMEILLAAHADTRVHTKDGDTALGVALTRGKMEVAAVLANADPNVVQGKKGSTALHEAVREGRIEVINLLVAAGADPNVQDEFRGTPLHDATRGDREDTDEIVKLLLAAGADPNVQDASGSSPLFRALEFSGQHKHDPIGVVRLLLDTKADPNLQTSNKQTALIAAVDGGRIESARLLLAAGADPNVVGKNSIGTSETALYLAVQQGKVDAARLLLTAGADANLQWQQKSYDDEMESALSLALLFQKWRIAIILVRYGAKPTLKDIAGLIGQATIAFGAPIGLGVVGFGIGAVIHHVAPAYTVWAVYTGSIVGLLVVLFAIAEWRRFGLPLIVSGFLAGLAFEITKLARATAAAMREPRDGRPRVGHGIWSSISTMASSIATLIALNIVWVLIVGVCVVLVVAALRLGQARKRKWAEEDQAKARAAASRERASRPGFNCKQCGNWITIKPEPRLGVTCIQCEYTNLFDNQHRDASGRLTPF